MNEFTIEASDGFALAARRYGAPAADKVIIINAATAVPQRFYTPFAEHLAEAGYAVVSYDYRGIGDSKPTSIRSMSVRARDWALLDMASVLDWVRDNVAPEIYFVGHSYGGQTAGLLPNAEHVKSMVTVASQSGYWKLQGGLQKVSVAFHMHVTFPVLSHTLGYFPWAKLSNAEDLPKGVALEWARWCRSPGYLLDDRSLPLERYQAFQAPVLAYSMSDDDWGTEASVNALMKVYPQLTRRHVSPQELGLGAIGHFGFFKPKSKKLWDEVLHWFEGGDATGLSYGRASQA